MQDYVTNYEEAVDFICRIPRFTSNYDFKNNERLLEIMGQPDSRMNIVHVAGTNGKGSVCAYLAELLQQAGLKVGLFTSPHLMDMRERFQINRQMISKDLFTEAVQYTQKFLASDKVRKSGAFEDYNPCFFDFLFFMCMYVFSREQVDILILETGLGGRLDATNAIKRKMATVITHIGLDHTEQLGNTIEAIAEEKAGIMAAGVPCVVGAHNDKVSHVFLKRAAELGSTCRILNEEDYGCQRVSEKSVAFSYFSSYYGNVPIKLNTTALYQAENASLAFAVLEELISQNVVSVKRLPITKLKKAFFETTWMGRMEEVRPGIFLDGAHNVDGAEAFLNSASIDGCMGKRRLLFSAVSDKDYKRMLADMIDSKLFAEICVTQIAGERGVTAEVLYEALEGLKPDESIRIGCIPNLSDGITYLLTKQQHLDYIYIIGSLYLVGQTRKLLSNHEEFSEEKKGELV